MKSLALRFFLAVAAVLAATSVFAQGALLQSGPWKPGRAPMYVGSGNSQAVVTDSGPASGGNTGVGLSELGLTIRNPSNAYPAANAGTGPLKTNVCDYDAPINNIGGYHYLCFSPNAQGGGLIAYGPGGTASPLPFQFYVNGSYYQFPFAIGGIVGPSTTVVGDLAVWNNTAGTLLKDVAQITPAQLPSIAAATVLCNATAGSAPPTACASLPPAVQLLITQLGTISAGVWNGTPITGSFIAPATITGSNIAAATVTGGNIAASTITGGNIASATVTGANVAAATIAGSNLVANTVSNANLAQAPANTFKCNPTAALANEQDCTGGAINVFTSNHLITAADCNTTIVMSTGATGSLGVTLPSTSGFTPPCPILIHNADATRGDVLAGFPAGMQPRLYPGQSVGVDIATSNWITTYNPGRWKQPGPHLYVDGGGADTNDCLGPNSGACKTITAAFLHEYQEIDNDNGSPTISLAGGQVFTECVVVQGQLTGVNVGFVTSTTGTGTSGGATWEPGASCPSNAVFSIEDNAEWEIQNIFMTNAGGTSGLFGIHMHQTGVVDVLSGMNFGMFPGAVAIGSDNQSMINMDASYTITGGGGTTPTFFGIGPATTLNECGACSTVFSGGPTITVLYSVTGAGSTVNFGSSHTFSGSATITNACVVNGPSAISQSSNSIPGSTGCSGAITHGGQVF